MHSKRLKKLCLIRHFIVLVAVVLLEKGFCYPRGRRHHNLVPRVAQPLLLLSRTFYERSNSGYAMKPKKKKKNSKTTNRHQNAVEYIAGKSFLFISFKKK